MNQIVASYRVGYKNCCAQLSVRLAVNLCWSGTSLLKSWISHCEAHIICIMRKSQNSYIKGVE